MVDGTYFAKSNFHCRAFFFNLREFASSFFVSAVRQKAT